MMTEPINQLTDKEKEALRLLLEGHETKSSAAILDLSVHTINDRLRNARRKLGVSSSREAARILREAEGDTPTNAPVSAPQTIPQNTPENDVHTSFGMAGDDASPDNAILTQTKRAEPFRFTWLAGGMLIMSLFIAAAVLAVVSTSGGEGATAPVTAAAATNAAGQTAESMEVAEKFIASVDAGDWAQSWRDAGEVFQTEASAAEWAEVVEPVRAPLGEVEERRLLSADKVTTLPGAPEGDYEVIQFHTKYENVETLSVETVIMVRNGNGYEVAGYFIR